MFYTSFWFQVRYFGICGATAGFNSDVLVHMSRDMAQFCRRTGVPVAPRAQNQQRETDATDIPRENQHGQANHRRHRHLRRLLDAVHLRSVMGHLGSREPLPRR